MLSNNTDGNDPEELLGDVYCFACYIVIILTTSYRFILGIILKQLFETMDSLYSLIEFIYKITRK